MSLADAANREGDIGDRCGRPSLPRRDLFIGAAVILFLNQLFEIAKDLPAASLATLISDLAAVGVFQYMAWWVVLRLLGSSDPGPATRWQDFLAVASLCLLVFLPTSRMIWVAATGIAIYMWILGGGDARLRAAATVLAALSVQELWGHIFFNFVAFPLLRAETAIVGTMLQAVRAGTVWRDNVITGPDGYGIVVYTGCSVFHNLSLAMLCWVTVSRFRGQRWQGRDLMIGGVAGATMIVLNIARLSLMAWDVDLFDYWHDGAGAEIFAIGAALAILLISLCGARPARRAAEA